MVGIAALTPPYAAERYDRRGAGAGPPIEPLMPTPEMETCPKCSAKFAARGAVVSWGRPLGFNVFTFSDISVAVRCPECWHQFPSQTIRFFGFLSPNGLRWVLVGILAICFVVVLASRPGA